jgi:hypothetical protein
LCDLRDEDNHSPHQARVANSINLRCNRVLATRALPARRCALPALPARRCAPLTAGVSQLRLGCQPGRLHMQTGLRAPGGRLPDLFEMQTGLLPRRPVCANVQCMSDGHVPAVACSTAVLIVPQRLSNTESHGDALHRVLRVRPRLREPRRGCVCPVRSRKVPHAQGRKRGKRSVGGVLAVPPPTHTVRRGRWSPPSVHSTRYRPRDLQARATASALPAAGVAMQTTASASSASMASSPPGTQIWRARSVPATRTRAPPGQSRWQTARAHPVTGWRSRTTCRASRARPGSLPAAARTSRASTVGSAR